MSATAVTVQQYPTSFWATCGLKLKSFSSKLYNWVALSIVAGAVIGHVYPNVGVAMQPLADGFIGLIKMLIPPVILCTVVLGIAGAGSIKRPVA